MKIRDSFVSNSSSCSFCVIGVKIKQNKKNMLMMNAIADGLMLPNEDPELLDEWYSVQERFLSKESPFEIYCGNGDTDIPNDQVLIGKSVKIEEHCGFTEVPMGSLMEQLERVTEIFDEELVICTGTEMC